MIYVLRDLEGDLIRFLFKKTIDSILILFG